ncbi:hypothetical protein V6N11_054677 [Hibiscus sabdariffa]|uniref:Uncharacterized protein n=1 Tax=Hibiscus sabdariffa TaxID=183260 RepID=A0ABR2S4M8_9ROSI
MTHSQTSSTVRASQSMPTTTSSELTVFMPTPSIYPQSMTTPSPQAMPTPTHQPMSKARRKPVRPSQVLISRPHTRSRSAASQQQL